MVQMVETRVLPSTSTKILFYFFFRSYFREINTNLAVSVSLSTISKHYIAMDGGKLSGPLQVIDITIYLYT